MKPQTIQTTELDDGRIRIEATFGGEDVDAARRMGNRMLAYGYEIDSRSDDDIPLMLNEKVGAEQVEAALSQAVPGILAPFVLDTIDFYTILEPQIEAVEEVMAGAPLTIAMTVVPRPSYELSSYDPPIIELPKAKLDEEEVEGYLAMMLTEYADYEQLGEDARADYGDRVVFDLETNREFGPVPHLTGAGKTATIGEGWLAKEFDEAMLRMKPGERKNFQFEALTETSEDENDTETFYVRLTMQEIWRPGHIELSDAWVADHIPGATSVDELRQMVQDQMIQGGEQPADERALLALTAEVLSQRVEVQIPDALYEQVVNGMIAQMDQQALSENKDFDGYLEGIGLTMDTLGEFLMRSAKSQIEQGFALDAWYRHFGLEFDSTDIDAAVTGVTGIDGALAVESQLSQFEMSGRMYLLREAAARYCANRDAASKAVIEYVD